MASNKRQRTTPLNPLEHIDVQKLQELYSSDGFVVLPSFLSDQEIQALQLECDALVRAEASTGEFEWDEKGMDKCGLKREKKTT